LFNKKIAAFAERMLTSANKTSFALCLLAVLESDLIPPCHVLGLQVQHTQPIY
jgi:hypothetical protein